MREYKRWKKSALDRDAHGKRWKETEAGEIERRGKGKGELKERGRRGMRKEERPRGKKRERQRKRKCDQQKKKKKRIKRNVDF